MPWRCTALEDLDDDHATAAAWTVRLGLIGGGSGGLAFRFCNGEQRTRACDVVGAGTAGEQAVVTDAVKAGRQDVDQESADELGGSECHDLLAITAFGTIVFPSESDSTAVAGDQPAVGDGDAVGIARQIGQHGLWPTERALGIHHPFGSAQRCQIGHERSRVGESGVIAEELEAVGLVGGEQPLQKQPSEQAREHAHRQRHATQRSPSSLPVTS